MTHYFTLVHSEGVIKAWLAAISAAYEEAHRQIDAVERPQAPDEAPW